MHKQYMYRG